MQKRTDRLIVWLMAFLGVFVLCCFAAVFMLRSGNVMDVPLAQHFRDPNQVRVKASDKVSPMHNSNWPEVNVSLAVSVVCGFDEATADRYEERNDALRSIARRSDIAQADIVAMMAYVCATGDTLRVERTAALKNDVLNLLRNQNPMPEGLAGMLIEMFNSCRHPDVVLDYCIQHLGAMQNDITDEPLLESFRSVFVSAAKRIDRPFAGTALYALADDRRATALQESHLRRLTVAACETNANQIVRMAAIQLAGQRGYSEVLPRLRKLLEAPSCDTVTDMVAIGSIGLLGGSVDLPLLEKLRSNGGVRLRPAIDAAIARIVRKDGGKK